MTERRDGGLAGLVPTKLRAPEMDSRVRVRPRLLGLLDAGERVTVVIGPIGYGKTVAVAQWAETVDVPLAWLSVDHHDQPAGRFWQYVTAALATIVAIPAAASARSGDEWHRGGVDAVADLLGLLGKEGPPAVLVIDDVHVITNASTLDQLAFFVDWAPPWLRLVLTSRGEPTFSLSRLRMRHRLTEIRQRELQLTALEARQVLAAVDELTIADDDLQLLIDRVDGWVAALRLIALMLAGGADSRRVVRDVVADDRILIDFLVGDVLDRLPVDERDAVLSLALLDDIDAARCQVMTGTDDGEALLRRLVDRGLPLSPLDASPRTVGFHRLFRDLVRQELTLRRRSELPDLHRRAAEAELGAGNVAATVRHLLAAGEGARAFDLFVAPGWELYDGGRARDGGDWIGQFPEELIFDNAERAVRYATALTLLGQSVEAEEWNRRALELIGPADHELHLEVLLNRMVSGVLRGDSDGARSQLEDMRRLSPGAPEHWDPPPRVVSLLGVAALTDANLDDAATWLGVLSADPEPHERGRAIGGRARRAWLALEQGDLAEGERLADACLAAAGEAQQAAGHALVEAMAVEARISTEHRRFDAAASWAARAADLADSLRAPLHRQLALHARLGVVDAVEGPAAALDAAVGAHPSSGDGAALWRRHHLLVADLAARAGRLEVADEHLAAIPDSYGRRLVAARLGLARGIMTPIDLWLPILSEAMPIALRIQAALLRYQARPLESGHLRQALELGVERGFVHIYLREGPTVVADLRRAVWHDTSWRSSPLGLATRQARSEQPDPQLSLVEPLSPRELEVLRLLPTHLSAIEQAAALRVSVNTVRTHIKAIYRKLGTTSRSEAVRQARSLGFLDAPGEPS